MLEFIWYSILFGLAALSVYIITSNQNEQIRNQKMMVDMLRDIRANTGELVIRRH